MKIAVFVLLLSAHCELIIALYRQHYFINEEKSWYDAQSYCREHYDDLSSVDSPKEFTGISNARNLYPWSWVGLYVSSGYWQWSDGSNQNVYNYGYYNVFNGFCTFVGSGTLYSSYCKNAFPFFCYNWEPELILVRENKSWEDALEYCRTHHTDLASLPSYLHLIQVKQTTAMAESPSVWTGLRFLSGSWFWVSGEDLGDIVQLPACPADHSYCGSRNLNTQRWENRDCMEELYFLCY